ncbi:MAG: transglycosylase SLT domain-containing protein [Parvibaculaceae bacterium]
MLSKKAVIMAMALMLGLSGDARAEVAKELKAAIAGYAAMYGLPASLVHRVVKRESRYNPRAYHRGHYGLMQIRYDTARTMGYRGKPKGLLDVDANLRYGVKYLAGAYLVSGGNADRAVRYYRSGYYYAAKRKGLLEETGLRTRR